MFKRLTMRRDNEVFVNSEATGWTHNSNWSKPAQEAIDRLAAYEDSGLSPEQVQELAQAKAEGKLVVLPCKIDEKVYRYCNDAINEGTIINILLNVKTGEIGLEYEMPTCYTCSRSGTLGKNLFLTREEAEKALAEVLP